MNNSSSDAAGCVILRYDAFIPWDNEYNVIAFETVQLIDRILMAYVIPLLYVIGLPANVVNMVVFYKQGLRERINVSLFLMALLDVLLLTFIFVQHSERIYTQFTHNHQYGPVLRFMVNNNLIGMYGLSLGLSILSAVIATERCICVLFPLHAHRCCPTKAFAVVIIVSICVAFVSRFVITAPYRVTCFYEVRAHRMTWQITVTDYKFQNKLMFDILDGMIHGFVLAIGCPIVVLIATIITAIKLRRTVQWRRSASIAMERAAPRKRTDNAAAVFTSSSSSSKASTPSASSREIGVTKMLICLSIENVILSIPVIIFRVIPLFEPDLRVGGKYHNSFQTLVAVSETCSFLSSSVNFFVYYCAGSKYRETLHALFRKKGASAATEKNVNVSRL